MFRGIFTGFQLKDINVETCVKDAEHVVDNFQQAFVAFEDREIYKGLNLMGQGLNSTALAMKDCKVTSTIVSGIEKFAKDLMSCVKGNLGYFMISFRSKLANSLIIN